MLRVVTYHRVAWPEDTPDLDPALISATPDVFTRQVAHLKSRYDVVSMSDVLAVAGGSGKLPRRAVLLTFDDAYRDFKVTAWPELRRHRLPVTVFVPTAFAGDPSRCFWWDRLHGIANRVNGGFIDIESLGTLSFQDAEARRTSLKRMRAHVKSMPHAKAMALIESLAERTEARLPVKPAVLNWDELRQLAAAGVTLAAHTRTHPMLTRISTEEMCDEIVGSQEDLRRNAGSVLPAFCYPAGGVNDDVVRVLKKNDFVLGFTTMDGHNDLKEPGLLQLRRTNITMRTSPGIFRFRLSRLGSYIDQWRHRN